MAEQRRDTLKIIGAIGATCAFPFSSDELYGQQEHVHGTQKTAGPVLSAKPAFFTPQEFETVKRLADLIIPPSDTPGAVEAGVPIYIDYVVNSGPQWRTLFREGIQWLDQKAAAYGKAFQDLTEAQQIAILTPLSEQSDRKPTTIPREVLFFRALKGMTADGYFTSKDGLVDTLGYKGNTIRAQFPTCE